MPEWVRSVEDTSGGHLCELTLILDAGVSGRVVTWQWRETRTGMMRCRDLNEETYSLIETPCVPFVCCFLFCYFLLSLPLYLPCPLNHTHTLKCHTTNRHGQHLQINTIFGRALLISPFHFFPPPPSFHAESFLDVMNAIIWRGRWFHPQLLAAGPSMKASVCASNMAFPLGHS